MFCLNQFFISFMILVIKVKCLTSLNEQFLNNKSISDGDVKFVNKRSNDIGTTLLYEYPFMVSLQENEIHYCTGTLITIQQVLTSARCLFYKSNDEWIMRNPENTFAVTGCFEDGCPLPVKAEKFNIHSSYDPNSITNDIALIKLMKPLNKIRVLDLRSEIADTIPQINSYCLLIKWINTQNIEGDIKTPVKRLIVKEVVLVNDTQCSRKYRDYQKKFSPTLNLCGTGISDSCEMDLGSPLFCGSKQVGILSYGFNCKKISQKPTLLTRVDSYHKWLTENKAKNNILSFNLIIAHILIILLIYIPL